MLYCTYISTRDDSCAMYFFYVYSMPVVSQGFSCMYKFLLGNGVRNDGDNHPVYLLYPIFVCRDL